MLIFLLDVFMININFAKEDNKKQDIALHILFPNLLIEYTFLIIFKERCVLIKTT